MVFKGDHDGPTVTYHTGHEDFQDQMKLFASAALVVGVHGAAV